MSEPHSDERSIIQVLPTQSLSLAAPTEIDAVLLASGLQAGERVNENPPATRLGISRTPGRDACRATTAAGLAQAHVNGGVFVRALEHENAVEIYDIRARLGGCVRGQPATRTEAGRRQG